MRFTIKLFDTFQVRGLLIRGSQVRFLPGSQKPLVFTRGFLFWMCPFFTRTLQTLRTKGRPAATKTFIVVQRIEWKTSFQLPGQLQQVAAHVDDFALRFSQQGEHALRDAIPQEDDSLCELGFGEAESGRARGLGRQPGRN